MIPTFNYKQYLDQIVSMKDQGHVDADQQKQAPRSAGARGLRKTHDFIKQPVQMMGESDDPTTPQRPSPANPNPKAVFENWLQNKVPTRLHETARKWFAKHSGKFKK